MKDTTVIARRLIGCALLPALMLLPFAARAEKTGLQFKSLLIDTLLLADMEAGIAPKKIPPLPRVKPARLADIEPAAGEEKLPVTRLRDAVAAGIATNPDYGAAASARRATDEELEQARSLYRPAIDLRADTGLELSEDAATRAGTGNDREIMKRYDAGLTLTQMLFDGGETRSENLRQQARVLSSAHRVREASELIGLSIIEAYLDVLRQRKLLAIAADNIAAHEDILTQIKDSTEAGRSTEADTQQALARLAAARAQEATLKESLETAEAAYIRQTGVLPKNLELPEIPENVLAEDVEVEVRTALHQSPTLSIFQSDVAAAHAEFMGTMAAFYPQMDLQLNARQGSNLNGVEGRDSSASALLVMNWNLYRGGGDSARVREFIHREAQAKESKVRAARGIENDVRQTWSRMVSARKRAKEFAAQAAANSKVFSSYKDQFDLSRRTLLDVLDAQSESFVSQANQINAEFLEIFAVYRLLALKGELLETLGVDYPREAEPANL